MALIRVQVCLHLGFPRIHNPSVACPIGHEPVSETQTCAPCAKNLYLDKDFECQSQLIQKHGTRTTLSVYTGCPTGKYTTTTASTSCKTCGRGLSLILSHLSDSFRSLLMLQDISLIQTQHVYHAQQEHISLMMQACLASHARSTSINLRLGIPPVSLVLSG